MAPPNGLGGGLLSSTKNGSQGMYDTENPHQRLRYEMVCYMSTNDLRTRLPASASRVLARFCVSLNDNASDAERQKLLHFVPRLSGTASYDVEMERRRAFLLVDMVIREALPALCEVAGMPKHAATLSALPPMTSAELALRANLADLAALGELTDPVAIAALGELLALADRADLEAVADLAAVVAVEVRGARDPLPPVSERPARERVSRLADRADLEAMADLIERANRAEREKLAERAALRAKLFEIALHGLERAVAVS